MNGSDGDELAEHPLFGSMSLERRASLLAAVGRSTLAAGTSILKRGGPATHAYVLQAGRVRVFHTLTGGMQLTVKAFSAPALFGEAEVLSGVPFAQSATALTEVRLLSIPAERFRLLLDEEPSFARALCFDLGARLIISSHQERAIASAPTRARLAGYLLDHAAWVAEGGELIVDMTQDEMSYAIGVSRRSVATHVGEWLAEGVLVRVPRGYEIARSERLDEEADPERPRLHYSLLGRRLIG